MSTAEACTRLGIVRPSLIRMVDRGVIVPVQQLGGPRGAYIFNRADVEALAEKRATRSALAGGESL